MANLKSLSFSRVLRKAKSALKSPGSIAQRQTLLDSGLFDEAWYRQANPSVIREVADPALHFLEHGKTQRLSPSRAFNTARYLDECASASTSPLNPLLHYLFHGRDNGFVIHGAPPSEADRVIESGYFDEQWYLSRYPDVENEKFPAFLHYIAFGVNEGRSPGPAFDAEWYLARYPDIAGMHPLLHYIDHGIGEGRLPLPPVANIVEFESEVATADTDEHAAAPKGIGQRVTNAFQSIVDRVEVSPSAIVLLGELSERNVSKKREVIHSVLERYPAQSVLILHAEQSADVSVIATEFIPLTIPQQATEEALTDEQRTQLLDFLVRGFRPEILICLDGRTSKELIKQHAMRIAQVTSLHIVLSQDEQDSIDDEFGSYLRHALQYATRIHYEQTSAANDLADHLALPELYRSRLAAIPNDPEGLSDIWRSSPAP